MKALILAAGKGTRMYPLTETRPKPMLLIGNKPILEHIILAFKRAGIKDFVIVIDQNSPIRNYFGHGKNFGVKISYVYQFKKLGTAHAILQAEKFLKKDFIVSNADNLVGFEAIKELKNTHKGAATLCLYEAPPEKLKNLGVVETYGKKVTRIVEKPAQPRGKFANTGMIAFSPVIFDAIKKIKKTKRKEYELPDAIQLLIKKKEQVSWVKTKDWIHITYPWDLLDANKFILDRMDEKIDGIIEDNVVIKGKVSIGRGTRIKSGVYIEGPVMIGKNCTIGPNCFIRNYVTLGDEVRVGNAVELKNTIIFNHTYVPHLSYLGDSVVGENVNFGAGAIMTNLRFDNKHVKVNVKGKLIDTGRRKLGAIIGDNVKFGSHVVVNPGRKIGPNSFIHPSVVVYKDVPENTEYK